jgi:protein TonB
VCSTRAGWECRRKSRIEEPPKQQPPPAKAVIVSKGAQLAKLIHQVKPIYPPLARAARMSGTVQLIAVIAKDGTVHNLQALSGNPLLVRAALDAVSQWIYRPTLLSGEPVEVTAPIEVNFILTQ